MKNSTSIPGVMSKLIVLMFGVFPILCLGQVTDQQKEEIDALFNVWDIGNYPGGVVGVIQSDKMLYLNSFGNASLEYNVPNSKNTLFNIGSISKQFTAMGIIVLQEKGLLSVDDPVGKYFPDFPIFQKPITIKHLLHHTSGLRDFHDLLALAGWRGDDYRNNEDILRFVQKQTDLNFEPGEMFMYSNTGYVLLAAIIEKVTDEDFGTWMKRHVFDPLDLKNTYVEDNYQRIVPNNATSYYHSHDKVFEMAQGYWAYTGAGNMHSSAEDLLKWATNFYNPKRGWESSFQMIQTLVEFNNGSSGNYAFGIYIDELYGKKRIQHAGVIGGYRTFLCTYPEKETSVVVLTNFSNAPFGEKADDVVGIIFSESRKKVQPSIRPKTEDKKENFKSSSIPMTDYTGMYFSPEIDTWISLNTDGNSLKLSHVQYGEIEVKLRQEDELRGSWPFETIKVSRNPKGEVLDLYISTGRVKNLWFKKIKSSIN